VTEVIGPTLLNVGDYFFRLGKTAGLLTVEFRGSANQTTHPIQGLMVRPSFEGLQFKHYQPLDKWQQIMPGCENVSLQACLNLVAPQVGIDQFQLHNGTFADIYYPSLRQVVATGEGAEDNYADDAPLFLDLDFAAMEEGNESGDWGDIDMQGMQSSLTEP